MIEAINSFVQTMSGYIEQNMWLAPFIVLFAGVLTSFSPCCLSTVPLVIGYVGGVGNKDTKNAFLLSITFAAGMAVTFTALGTIASLFGKLMLGAGKWWFIVLGILMILMALQTWEVYNFIPSTYLTSKNTKKGFIGAFLTGILAGAFSSPCATPILVVIISLVSAGANIAWGVFLLLLYSIGHSALVVVAGTSVGFVKKITQSEKYGLASSIIKFITGALIMLIAVYLLYLGF